MFLKNTNSLKLELPEKYYWQNKHDVTWSEINVDTLVSTLARRGRH